VRCKQEYSTEKTSKEAPVSGSGGRDDKKRQMEDELRDPKNFVEYFIPRPVRQWYLWGSGASCLLALLLNISRILREPALLQPGGSGVQDLVINVAGVAVFFGLAAWDQSAAEKRVEQRKQIRQAQIRLGDREVYLNEQGEKMSRLKEVNDEFIVRRLERWGRRDGMPFMGPVKGAVLQQLVGDKAPRLVLEVGTMAGYSALLMAQVLPPGGRIISMEKDLTWVLVAKRFMWQASQGERNAGLQQRIGDRVDVWWGDALNKLPEMVRDAGIAGKVELLLLDGVPKEYLSYLKAAEPLLAPGALVVADNAGVFKDGGLKPYLEYVRSSPLYRSSFIESTLEWREDVKDGIEVSVYMPQGGQGEQAPASPPSPPA